jgi:hypothetical protein
MEEPKKHELAQTAENPETQEASDKQAQNAAKRDDMFRTFRCIVAAYLVYLACDLGVSVFRGQTTSAAPYLAAAIVFLAAGVFFLIRDLPPLLKEMFSRRK